MVFPTIPTVGDGRLLTTFQANTTSPRTFPNLSSLTKNAGDLLIAIIVNYQSSLTSNIYSSWGAGFTEIRDIGVASQMCLGVAYKISDGTETGTFTVAQAGTITGHAGMILMSIPGAHGTTPPEVSAALANATGAAANPAALDPAGWATEDTLWIAIGANGETSTSGTYTGMGLAAGPPTNYTNAVSTGESADVVGAIALAVAFRQNATSSEDVGAWSSIDTSNARNVAAVIAVRPAPVTAVGKDLQLVYNQRAAVGKALQSVWNMRSAVGKAVQAVWDVLFGTPGYHSIVNDDAPVVHYRLGEASGAAIDEMGVQNATASGSLTRAVGGAIIDGDGAVQVAAGGGFQITPKPAALNFAGGPFSIETWVKRGTLTTGATFQLFVDFGYSGASGIHMGFGLDDKIRLMTHGSPWKLLAQSAGSITDSTWHHVVGTWSGSGTQIGTMYVDGLDVTSGDAPTTTAVADSTGGPWIGRGVDAGFDEFLGSLDELAIYDTELTASQVAAHYAAGTSPYAQEVLIDVPVGYWRLGEASGDPQDFSGNGHVLTVVSGTPTFGVAGAIAAEADTAITFDGTSENFSLADSSPFRAAGTAPFTIEAWAKQTSMVGAFREIVSCRNASAHGWALQHYSTAGSSNEVDLTWTNSGGGSYYGFLNGEPARFELGWHHFVASFDGTRLRLYIDGSLVHTSDPVAGSLPSDGVFRIGGRVDFYNGTIDEVAFYDSALSPTRVAAHYAIGAVLVAGRALQAVWNQRAAAGKSLQGVFNVRTSAGKSVQSIWKMRSAVGKSVQSIWKVRAAVGKSVQSIWKVRAAVGRSLQPVWKVWASVGKSLQPVWNVKTAVGKSVESIWNVLVLAGGSAVGKALDLRWNLRSTVGNTVESRFNVRAAVGKTLQSRFNVRAAVNRSLQARFGVQTSAGKALQSVFGVKSSVGKSVQAQFRVRSVVGKSVQAQFPVRAGIGKAVQAVWNEKAIAGRTLGVQFAVRSVVGKTVTAQYRVREAVMSSKYLIWHVVGPIAPIADDTNPESRIGRRNRARIDD